MNNEISQQIDENNDILDLEPLSPQTTKQNQPGQYLEEIDIISSQTGEDDKLYIERVFMECGSDVSKTIIKILNIDTKVEIKEKTVFDEIRQILNEKDALYFDMMAKKTINKITI